MLLALEKRLAPDSRSPETPEAAPAESRLNISVLFTSVEATLAALRQAGDLASRLGARITIVVPQLVPFPLPLTCPPVLLDFNERRFRVIASQSPVETSVRLYLCRDQWDALGIALKPRSLVVVGSRRRWWPTAERRLAGRLRRAGHEVILTETE